MSLADHSKQKKQVLKGRLSSSHSHTLRLMQRPVTAYFPGCCLRVGLVISLQMGADWDPLWGLKSWWACPPLSLPQTHCNNETKFSASPWKEHVHLCRTPNIMDATQGTGSQITHLWVLRSLGMYESPRTTQNETGALYGHTGTPSSCSPWFSRVSRQKCPGQVPPRWALDSTSNVLTFLAAA